MAKLKPTFTLAEMERKLGYKIDNLNYPDDCVKRLYSDLRPVLHDIYERTKKEFEEHEKQRFRKDTIIEKDLPRFSRVHVPIGAFAMSRQANIIIDNCPWSGHSDVHTKDSRRLLQFCCRYTLYFRIKLAAIIH